MREHCSALFSGLRLRLRPRPKDALKPIEMRFADLEQACLLRSQQIADMCRCRVCEQSSLLELRERRKVTDRKNRLAVRQWNISNVHGL